jgi:uncharacterized protein YqjF (DUF2071 family)
MSFLKAEWRKLVLANYVIDPAILEAYVPYGTELDLWQDRCYVSLVGFMFINTKLLGVKIPFHVNFEEVNLRFYVKRRVGNEWRRGVVFIKEIVPKPALTFVANTLYKEHYQTLPMKHSWEFPEDQQRIEYSWKVKNKWNKIEVVASKLSSEITQDSEAEFITEHYWGYAKVNDHKTNEYEVTHPRWQQYSIIKVNIDADFEMNYGKQFGFLNQMDPASVMLAEGSQITVESKRVLED